MKSKKLFEKCLTISCKLAKLSIDLICSHALYVIGFEITHSRVIAFGAAVVFFLLNLSIDTLAYRMTPARRASSAVFVWGIKLSVAFLEAVLLWNSSIPGRIEIEAQNVTKLIRAALEVDPALLLFVFLFICILELMTTLLPGELPRRLRYIKHVMRPGCPCTTVFQLVSSEDKIEVLIQYSISGKLPDGLDMELMLSDGTVVDSFGVVSGSNTMHMHLVPNKYELVFRNRSGNKREGKVTVEIFVLDDSK